MAEEPRRSDLHAWLLDRYGASDEAHYMLAGGLITINGFAALLLKQPLLFPSLSPTVFTLFRQSLTK
jgi:CBS domain-containing membrane protein